MGSAALAAAVPYPGKATQISHKGQRNTTEKYAHFVFTWSSYISGSTPTHPVWLIEISSTESIGLTNIHGNLERLP